VFALVQNTNLSLQLKILQVQIELSSDQKYSKKMKTLGLEVWLSDRALAQDV
jgi:hypothetical protein